LNKTLSNAPETISTAQFNAMIVTSNMAMSYLSKERPAKDPIAKTKLMTKSHRIARSSLPPAKTPAVKRKATFIIKYPRPSRPMKIP
jgi:hypothetical protein